LATKIRLKRMGARGNPHYRLVVMDSKRPRDGNTIEEIGYYCPTTEPPTIEVQVNRALHWLCTGAQPSDTVRSLLAERGVMEAFRSGVKPGQMPEEVTPVVTPEQATQSAEQSSQLAAEQHEETPPEQDSVQ
jgi:small subunit ribosomal protein S16